jgi:hypothetical protein
MSITSKNSLKLYDHLTSRQKSVLAFNALMMGNEEEAQRIVDTVPKFNYSQRDDAFIRPCEQYFDLVATFGLEYWKLQNSITSCNGLLMYYEQRELEQIRAKGKIDDELYKKVDDIYNTQRIFQSRQAALIKIMVETCERLGITTEVVIKLVGFTENDLQPHSEPCEKELSLYADIFGNFEKRLTS